MAYIRGDQYVWSDDRAVHIWVADGYDGWDESGWAQGHDVPKSGGQQAGPAGVALPVEVADEYVVMRLAQLVQERTLSEAVNRALSAHGGNFGCDALRMLAMPIVSALTGVSAGRESEE